MWPLKRKIPYLKDINIEGDQITFLHSQGANRFSKDEILTHSFESDMFSSSVDENYSIMNKLLFFIFLGGFYNMFYSLFPAFLWENDQKPKVYSEIWFSQNLWGFSILHHFIILGLATLFAYLTYLLIFCAIKKYRLNNSSDKYQKDIIRISLNNVEIKVECSSDFFSNELKLLFNKTPDEVTEKTSLSKFLLRNWLPVVLFTVLAIILFILNYDVPFWFKGSKNYWKYYGTWDNTMVIHMMNPLKAFFHGILSNSIFLLIVIVIPLIFIAIGMSFVYVPAALLLYAFTRLFLLTEKTKLIKFDSEIFRYIFNIVGFLISFGIFILLLEVIISNDWTNLDSITDDEQIIRYYNAIFFLTAVIVSLFNWIVILIMIRFKPIISSWFFFVMEPRR